MSYFNSKNRNFLIVYNIGLSNKIKYSYVPMKRYRYIRFTVSKELRSPKHNQSYYMSLR